MDIPTTIESGDFSGLRSLQKLDLFDNQITSLNLTGGDLAALTDLRLDTAEIDTLIVDGATLSQASFDVIVNSTSSITEGRFVGPDLTDTTNLDRLLAPQSLDLLTVDADLYHTWQGDLDAWNAQPGHTLNVIPEPATMTLLALGALAVLRRRRK